MFLVEWPQKKFGVLFYFILKLNVSDEFRTFELYIQPQYYMYRNTIFDSISKSAKKRFDRFNRYSIFRADIIWLLWLSLWIYFDAKEALMLKINTKKRRKRFCYCFVWSCCFCTLLLIDDICTIFSFWFFFVLFLANNFALLFSTIPSKKRTLFNSIVSKEINSKVALITLQEVRLNVTEKQETTTTNTRRRIRRQSGGEGKKCWLNKLTHSSKYFSEVCTDIIHIHYYLYVAQWHSKIQVASVLEYQPQNKIK